MPNPPVEQGTAWAERVAAYAREHGFAWDRSALHGAHDLLDITGCLPDGWLIGCKALSRKGNLGDRLSDAMHQNRRAAVNLDRHYPGLKVREDVHTAQVVQRQGYGVGRAYVVMEYDEFLALVEERRKWRTNQ